MSSIWPSGNAPLHVVVRHLFERPDAVVFVAGGYGAGHRQFVQAAVDELCADGEGTPGAAMVAVSRRIRPDAPERRLEAFDLDPGEGPAEIAARWIRRTGTGVFHVPYIHLLDEDSLQAVDTLLGSGRVRVVLSGAHRPRRYMHLLTSTRGLSADLPVLDAVGIEAVLRAGADVPAERRTADYLLRVGGGLHGFLQDVVRLGEAEGWLRTSEERLVVAAPPAWTDRAWARHLIERVAEVVSSPALTLLQRVALNGTIALGEVMRDPRERAHAVELESLGLVRMARGGLSIPIPALTLALGADPPHREALVGQWDEATGRDLPGRDTFMALRGGLDLTDADLTRGAAVALGAGLVERARALLAAADGTPYGAAVLHALVEATAGKGRTAICLLREEYARTGEDELRAAEEYVRSLCLRWERWTEERGTSIDPQVLDPPVDELYRSARIVRACDAFTGGGVTDEARPAHDEQPPEVSPEPSSTGLVTACLHAAHALCAGLEGRSQDAQAALAGYETLDRSGIPVLGLTWCVERVGYARLLTVPGGGPDDTGASSALSPSPSRSLFRAVPDHALALMSAVAGGEPLPVLRELLTDLRAVFEARMPKGTISRALVEALDLVVEGERSAELVGPPGVHAASLPPRNAEPLVATWAAMGRLLRCPAEVLREDWQLSGYVALPPVRRLIVRTVLLRRSASVPADVARHLAEEGTRADVEEEFIAYADAWASASADEIALAAARLSSTYPALRVEGPARLTGDGAYGGRDADPRRLALLTRREQEVAMRLIRGATTAQIGRDLGIADRTVDTHVRNAYRKLAVHSRTGLRAELMA